MLLSLTFHLYCHFEQKTTYTTQHNPKPCHFVMLFVQLFELYPCLSIYPISFSSSWRLLLYAIDDLSSASVHQHLGLSVNRLLVMNEGKLRKLEWMGDYSWNFLSVSVDIGSCSCQVRRSGGYYSEVFCSFYTIITWESISFPDF